ncbi:MAG: winged helix-turn-helix transcriptional regulator [Deltaproteobacteria bacterium]|nr:winged helix-turn-helix transcriptional regulator [Deltaproteobacteria bacterium]MBW2086018.1 winged helix-turn-helix transcriptional regulator [Deltaproteobacteria bacterium]
MNDFVKIIKGLADGTRFKMLNLLLTHDLCVGALAGQLGISKAAVSQHLQVLRKAGLVKGEKRGYWTHYAVDRAVLHQIANDIMKMSEQEPSAQGCCFIASSKEAPCSECQEFKVVSIENKLEKKEERTDVPG